jgi:predicted adenylyl cyclase CyaB
MKETEVKILEIDRQKIEQTLFELGAKKVFEGEIQTIFLDFKDSQISKQESLLRLRKTSKKTELTYKKVKHKQTVKIAEEYTVEVSDLEMMLKILESLGLSTTGKMEKHRISYKLEKAQFDIDKYTGTYAFIPEFMEIEAEDIDQINKYVKLFGYNQINCLPWSTEEVIQHYSKKAT